MSDDEMTASEIASILEEYKEHLHALEGQAHDVLKDYTKKLEETKINEIHERLNTNHVRENEE